MCFDNVITKSFDIPQSSITPSGKRNLHFQVSKAWSVNTQGILNVEFLFIVLLVEMMVKGRNVVQRTTCHTIPKIDATMYNHPCKHI